MTADGDRLVYSSLGAFEEPGNDSTVEGGEYVAVRGTSGWKSTPVNPSASEFQGGSTDQLGGVTHETLDFAAGLDATIFLAAPVGAKPVAAHFYLRDLGGNYSEIGPLVPPESVEAWNPGLDKKPLAGYLGASRDLNRVIFVQQIGGGLGLQFLWPGDTTLLATLNTSMYEYSGRGDSEPELVAIRNQTTLASAAASEKKDHINEAAEPLSQCGVVLGGSLPGSSGASDTYNAMAADGNVVFFTPHPSGCEASETGEVGSGPLVNEVYARVSRERTVDISEPTTGPSGDCPLCDESEPADALFQGASEDGSQVFFISAQKLFSGTAGEAGNNLYHYDFDAPIHEKLTLVAPSLPLAGGAVGGVVRVSEDGNYIYFVSEAKLADNLDANGRAAESTEEAGQKRFNLYVYSAAGRETTFIGSLAAGDSQDWRGEDSRVVEATPDGRFLLFRSLADLTPDVLGEGRQLYRYEVPSAAHPAGTLVRVSVGAPGNYECLTTKVVEAGFNCNGNAVDAPGSVFAPVYTRGSELHYILKVQSRPASVAMSFDGERVFFSSPVALTPGALNDRCAFEVEGECTAAALNVYEWESGHIYLLSDGRDTKPLFNATATKLIGANPTGSDVFFTTADALVPEDNDSQVDVYDAREGGGFPALPQDVSCVGGGCGSAAGTTPVFGAPASVDLVGAGNVAPLVSPSAVPRVSKMATQGLLRALRACRVREKARRVVCEARARKRYHKLRSARSRQRR